MPKFLIVQVKRELSVDISTDICVCVRQRNMQ